MRTNNIPTALQPQLVTSNTSITPPVTELGHSSPNPSDIDRYGELQRLVDLHKPVVAEHKSLKEKLEAVYEQLAAEKEFVAEGNLYQLRVGMKKNEREITNKSRLKRILSALKIFDQVWTVALGVIDKHVPEEQHKLFLIQERTGHRELRPVLKEAVESALPKAA
jgi:hypothetical protein